MRENLLDLDESELARRLIGMGRERFRAGQVLRWIYHQGVIEFERMSNVAKDVRAELARQFIIAAPVVEQALSSSDGAEKLLLRLGDGLAVETVLLPEPRRLTLCVSTQVGCRMGCVFCSTGRLGLRRNLSPGEIVGQLLVAGLRQRERGGREITNVVLMGMGEPLDNYDAVVRACRIMLNPHGPNLSTRRLTVSTAGVADRIAALVESTGVSLAVSLNAADDATRERLMPINRRFPLKALFDALEAVPLAHRRRITFEYVLIDGINDSAGQAAALAALLRRVPSKVNLIPLNPGPGIDYIAPLEGRVRAFQQELLDRHVTAIVRRPRGSDVTAACGQLVAGLLHQGGRE